MSFITLEDLKVRISDFDAIFWTDLDLPMSVNASISFEGGIKSSKLVRNIMNLCYSFGVGLTAPMLSQNSEDLMIFNLKQNIPSTRYAQKSYRHMKKCISTIEGYLSEVGKQMDFNKIDVSMFSDFDVDKINFDSIANQRDNKYNGSWENFMIDLKNTGNTVSVDLLEKCIEFEEKNNTDLGIITGQIADLLAMSKVGLFDHIAKS